MKIKPGANLIGLRIPMRAALIAADRIWRDLGIADGVTVTSALDGVHSAASWHYYGLALDFRTRYFDDGGIRVAELLRAELGPDYDVVLEPTHIHVEPSYRYLRRLGVIE